MLKNSGSAGVRTIRGIIFTDWLGSRGDRAMIFGHGLKEWDVVTNGLKDVPDEEIVRWLNQGQRLSSDEVMVMKVLQRPTIPIGDNECEAKTNVWGLLTRLTEWDGRNQIHVAFTNSNVLLQQWGAQMAGAQTAGSEPLSEAVLEMVSSLPLGCGKHETHKVVGRCEEEGSG
ncbi:hypothetical protein K440DRAFT_641320 [Wilcoxina mikolae CBS 423.85]|nr:hypothetical protein K440DRAFT_641320 [Wilcoxina mikolae CBS 423.85]